MSYLFPTPKDQKMNAIFRLALVSILITFGCATNPDWIQGEIVAMSSGVVMPMQIEKKRIIGGSASGEIIAQNPVTDEHFAGRYLGMLESSNGTGSVFKKAHAQATLVGDQGTTIAFDIEILVGWFPQGVGQGVDGDGRRYSLKFQ